MADDPSDGDFAPDGTGDNGKAMWGDDLKTSSKVTLASYMSSLTTNAQTHNEYSIPDSFYTEWSYVEADGSPAEFPTGGGGGAETFTEGLGTSAEASAARTLFDTMSNSGMFDEAAPTAAPLSSFLDKNEQTDGHHLLTDIKGTTQPFEPGIGGTSGVSHHSVPANAPIQQRKISEILKSQNRFNPSGDSPYIEDGAFSDSFATEQMGYGVYDPDGDGINFAKLKKVAESLLLRQTGHAKNADADPADWSQLSVIPSTTVQSGKNKISMEFLRSINAFGAPQKPSLPAELLYNDIDGVALVSQKSFGALNSNKEPFTGKNRIAMLAVAVDGIGAIILGAVVIGGIIDLLSINGVEIAGSPSGMRYGKYRLEELRVRVLRTMGVPPLNHSFIKCVVYGLIEFLGLAIEPPASAFANWGAFMLWWTFNVLPSIEGVVENILWASGYYANLLRVIRRDIEKFLDGALEIDLGTSSGAISMFMLATSLNKFQSFRFFMVLATIGDVALQRKKRNFPLGGRGSNPLEKMPDTGQTRQAKSRIAKDKNQLAWRHRSAPARFLLPEKLTTAFEVFDMGKSTPGILLNKVGDADGDPGPSWPSEADAPFWKKQQRNWAPSTTGRLSQELVTALENQMEIEYMPFYLHDLRTNEIIGLHGFLETIKDSYSVSYSDSSGYGRIDKVKIYQSTDRSISLDFWLVSTSEEDFDSMWFTVNKMITLLYPQWSMGKRVSAGKKHFVMPFSQIPTASPMIRLRVGDVIRSNYSRFNLARLFGLSEALAADEGGTSAQEGADASPAFDLSYDSQTGADLATYATALAAHNKRYGSEPTSPTDYTYGYSEAGTQECTLKANQSGYTTWDRGSATTPGVPALLGDGGASAGLGGIGPIPATNVETDPFLSRVLSPGRVRVIERRWIGLGGDDGTDPTAETLVPFSMRNNGFNVEYCVTWVDPDDGADPYSKALSDKGHYHHYYVTAADLTPDTPEMTQLNETVTLDEQITTIGAFFSPDNNAIVSSFEAAGGRGLAGFITSFDMDWGSSAWDMSRMGRRAPNAMKISIQFAPIHDIPPGLDNNGFMRSINYPVGDIASMFATDQYDEGSAGAVQVLTEEGTSRRVGGVDAGKITRERFASAVNEAFATMSTPGDPEEG